MTDVKIPDGYVLVPMALYDLLIQRASNPPIPSGTTIPLRDIYVGGTGNPMPPLPITTCDGARG